MLSLLLFWTIAVSSKLVTNTSHFLWLLHKKGQPLFHQSDVLKGLYVKKKIYYWPYVSWKMSFKNETFPISLLLPEQACGQFV